MNEKKGPNGFLLGLLIGGAVGALISTKRGRQIIKDIAEYGLDYVGSNINMGDIDTILNEEEEEIMNGEMEATQKETVHKKEEKVSKIYQPLKDEDRDEPSRRKRLFKGIRKK